MKEEEYRVPKEQASSNLELALLLPFAKSIVGEPGARGIRFVIAKYFAIESYTSFKEPILIPWCGIRVIFWKTKKQDSLPAGWKKWRGMNMGSTIARAYVHPDFLQDWTANARRLVVSQRKKNISCSRVSVKEFAKEYHASKYLDPFLRHGFIRCIQDHVRVHEQDVSTLIFSSQDNEVLGGVVFVDYPDIKQSQYLISFLTPEGRNQSAGYAFIYWWYHEMLKKGLTGADFGIVWAPGDPISWKGYSQFKERFRPELETKSTYWKWA